MKWFLYSLCVLALVVPAFAVEQPHCSIAETAMKTASRIRGLSVKRTVPCRLQDRGQVEAYLRSTIETKIPAERMRDEAVQYRMLGLIPEDFDYVGGLIRLYTDQLGGYYDPDIKSYAMAAWMPVAMQMPIAVHELTHALQDQHFSLGELTDQKTQPSDRLLARSALIEGDATAVMVDFSRETLGQQGIAKESSIASLMMQNLGGAMLSSSLNSAPSALQSLLIFPYMSGLHFVHSLLQQGGFAKVDAAFKRLPRSTEEILHPEKYLAEKADFEELELPTPPVDSNWASLSPIAQDVLGEFVVSTWLSTWIGPLSGSRAAAGWGGDRLALFRDKEGRHLLLWDMRWDSEEEAIEFLDALQAAYDKRFSFTARSASRQWENKSYRVSVSGEGKRTRLSIAESIPSSSGGAS